MTMFSPSDRDATLALVLDLLEADMRIEAAVVTGSLGAGRGDRWSDMDVDGVVVDAESCERVAADWTDPTTDLRGWAFGGDASGDYT
ncbi:MAG: hypothetical protein ACRDGV_01805 [Candidatus Limnocylindria bacterium]